MADQTEPLSPPLSGSPSLRTLLAFTLLVVAGFGILVPTLASGVVSTLFPWQANGSLVRAGDRVVGSVLVAQPFTSAGDFQPRPSAAGFDPMAASGSNQARSNPALVQCIAEARRALALRDGIAPHLVPDDLITQSGSGLDPDISRAGAEVQVTRVAAARGLSPDRVRALVAQHVRGPQWGLFGPARVNVLELNLALDALAPASNA